MAGSYNHIVDDDGDLATPNRVADMLDIHRSMGGDVYEAVKEMYGMIWYLADKYASGVFGPSRDQITANVVKEARRSYEKGLKLAKNNKLKRKRR